MGCMGEFAAFVFSPFIIVVAIFLYFFLSQRKRVTSGIGGADYKCCGFACFGQPAVNIDSEWKYRNFLPKSVGWYVPCQMPVERFRSWWRHGHEYTSPWHPWANESLTKEKRVLILLISASFSLLINTEWQSSFPDIGVINAGLLGVIGTVAIIKWALGIILPFSFQEFEKPDGFKGWRASSIRWKQLVAKGFSYASIACLVGIFAAVVIGLFVLTGKHNCNSLFTNVFFAFLLTEVVIAIPIEFAKLYLVYTLVKMRAKLDGGSQSQAFRDPHEDNRGGEAYREML